MRNKLMWEINQLKVDIGDLKKYSIDQLKIIKDLALVNANDIKEIVTNDSLVKLVTENEGLYKVLIESRRGKNVKPIKTRQTKKSK